MKDFSHITYATVGIDPVEFYAGKFAGGPGDYDYLSNPLNHTNIEFDRAKFLGDNVRGPRILDVGCGSAPFAATIRAATKPTFLAGVDLDETCVKIASKAYDNARVFDLGGSLPYDDGSFDTVFSCDVFGHIEFRSKDHVISEIHRVTAPGGLSVHIIESNDFDYDAMEHDNPNDPFRKYIWDQGHIGIESASALRARWSKLFDEVTIENSFPYPIAPIQAYATDGDIGTDLRKYLQGLNPSEIQAANVALGIVNQKLKRSFGESYRDFMTPVSHSAVPWNRHCGLVYLVARKN